MPLAVAIPAALNVPLLSCQNDDMKSVAGIAALSAHLGSEYRRHAVPLHDVAHLCSIANQWPMATFTLNIGFTVIMIVCN